MDLLVVNEGLVADEYLNELKGIFNRVIVYPFHSMMFKANALRGLFLEIHFRHTTIILRKYKSGSTGTILIMTLIFAFISGWLDI